MWTLFSIPWDLIPPDITVLKMWILYLPPFKFWHFAWMTPMRTSSLHHICA
jgi:hypothetical protein